MLRPEDLVAINVDMARAAGIVLAAEERIQTLADEIKSQLPGFDIGLVESLRDVALAAWYVHETIPPPAVDEGIPKRLINDAMRLRRALLLQAGALADRGLVDAERVAAIRAAGRSNADLANSLVALAGLFRGSWESIRGKTPVCEPELDRALKLAAELNEALGARERARTLAGEEMDPGALRVRAFSMLARTYDQVRRAVTYLRWNEDDQDEIAPSIYTGSRGGRRRP